MFLHVAAQRRQHRVHRRLMRAFAGLDGDVGLGVGRVAVLGEAGQHLFAVQPAFHRQHGGNGRVLQIVRPLQ